MDMSFSKEDEAFREEVRSFLTENLPANVAHKVLNGHHVNREEIMAWHRALFKKRLDYTQLA